MTAVYPAVGCGDGKGESWTQDMMTMMCTKDPEPDVRSYRIVDGAITEEPVELDRR